MEKLYGQVIFFLENSLKIFFKFFNFKYTINEKEFFINFMNILKADTVEALNNLRKKNSRSE